METIRELVQVGKQYFDQKDYPNAEKYLRQAIQKEPRYADVQNLLGVINHIEGNFEAAMTYFQQALKINPRYTEALLNLAVLYNDLGKYRQAKELYTSLKKSSPPGKTEIEPVLRGKLSNLHAEIGDIYRSIGLNPHAIEEYRKALNLNSNYHDIRTKLGQALREDGQLAKSLDELASVIKAKDNYSPARVQLGVTHYAMGKIEQAKKAWRDALAANPGDEYAKMYLRLSETQALRDQPKTLAEVKSKTAKSPKKR